MTTLLEPWWNGQKRYTGLSTDERPTDARNGDMIIEIDTRKIFLYSEEDDTWYEQPTGSGGSGSGSGDFSIATVTFRNVSSAEQPRQAYGVPIPMVSNDAAVAMLVDVALERDVYIILYRGLAVIPASSLQGVDMNVMPEVSGDVTLDPSAAAILIRGDGTFTAAGEKLE